MEVYESFQKFWQDYSAEKRNSFNFRDWQVVQILHTGDAEYQKQRYEKRDDLGFQPLMVTFANPFTKQIRQSLIKNVPDKIVTDFKQFCRNQYYDELSSRFGSFRPDNFHAFAEYEDWESFHKTWLQRNERPVFHLNIPLLLDFTPKFEYWTRKQTGQEVMPYQRLLITTYFVHKNKFFDFFIKNVDDDKVEQIKLLMGSQVGINLENLYSGARKNAYA